MNTITTRDPADPTQTCFVIMPYADEFDLIYDAINEAVRNLGLCCVRLDKARHAGKISDEMASEIGKSTLCIADLTGLNSNVMWEAGYAMALKRPVVLISQDAGNLPFDIKDYRVFEYDPKQDREVIALVIEAAIRETLKHSRLRKRKISRWVALVMVLFLATAAGLWATGLQIGLAPPGRCDLIHVSTDGGRVKIRDDIYVKLDKVETLEGHAEGSSSLSGHAFNKAQLGKGNIFENVLRAAGLPRNEASAIRKMDQPAWDSYLSEVAQKDPEKRARLTDHAFAQISVFRGKTALIDAEYFFRGDTLSVAGLPIKLELTNVYNTKRSSGEPESVALRIVN